MLLGTLGASLLGNMLAGKGIRLDWIRLIALFCSTNEIVYFDSFGVEYVPEEIKEFIGNKNIIDNIF